MKNANKLHSGIGSHFNEQLQKFSKKHSRHRIADPKYEIYKDIASLLDAQDTAYNQNTE